MPLAQAAATIDRVNSESDRKQLTIRRGERAVHLLYDLSTEQMEAFAETLESAKLSLATPKAACPQCGAPGQAMGLPCGYCGHAVAG